MCSVSNKMAIARLQDFSVRHPQLNEFHGMGSIGKRKYALHKNLHTLDLLGGYGNINETVGDRLKDTPIGYRKSLSPERTKEYDD